MWIVYDLFGFFRNSSPSTSHTTRGISEPKEFINLSGLEPANQLKCERADLQKPELEASGESIHGGTVSEDSQQLLSVSCSPATSSKALTFLDGMISALIKVNHKLTEADFLKAVKREIRINEATYGSGEFPSFDESFEKKVVEIMKKNCFSKNLMRLLFAIVSNSCNVVVIVEEVLMCTMALALESRDVKRYWPKRTECHGADSHASNSVSVKMLVNKSKDTCYLIEPSASSP
jgi:hypothetical protein